MNELMTTVLFARAWALASYGAFRQRITDADSESDRGSNTAEIVVWIVIAIVAVGAIAYKVYGWLNDQATKATSGS